MGMDNSWLVTSPSLATDDNDLDDEQSDGISIISESDRDDCRENTTSSQYFWDNTHISLSNKLEDITEKSMEPENDQKPQISSSSQTKRMYLILLINLILISNIVTYNILESQHSSTVEKYELAAAKIKDLRNEINTLRKIIFLMNIEEQTPESVNKDAVSEETSPNSEEVTIFDNKRQKYICVDIKRFVDML